MTIRVGDRVRVVQDDYSDGNLLGKIGKVVEISQFGSLRWQVQLDEDPPNNLTPFDRHELVYTS